MSKRDVNIMFFELQHQYFEMLNIVGEIQELRNEGKITAEELETRVKNVEQLKVNYSNMATFIRELNKPNKPNNKRADMYKWYDTYNERSKQVIIDEGADALKDLKDFLLKKKESLNDRKTIDKETK